MFLNHFSRFHSDMCDYLLISNILKAVGTQDPSLILFMPNYKMLCFFLFVNILA